MILATARRPVRQYAALLVAVLCATAGAVDHPTPSFSPPRARPPAMSTAQHPCGCIDLANIAHMLIKNELFVIAQKANLSLVRPDAPLDASRYEETQRSVVDSVANWATDFVHLPGTKPIWSTLPSHPTALGVTNPYTCKYTITPSATPCMQELIKQHELVHATRCEEINRTRPSWTGEKAEELDKAIRKTHFLFATSKKWSLCGLLKQEIEANTVEISFLIGQLDRLKHCVSWKQIARDVNHAYGELDQFKLRIPGFKDVTCVEPSMPKIDALREVLERFSTAQRDAVTP